MSTLNDIGIKLEDYASETLSEDNYEQLLQSVKSTEPNFPDIESEQNLKRLLYSFIDFDVFVVGDLDNSSSDNQELVISPYYQSLNKLNDILLHSSVRVVPLGMDYEIVITR